MFRLVSSIGFGSSLFVAIERTPKVVTTYGTGGSTGAVIASKVLPRVVVGRSAWGVNLG